MGIGWPCSFYMDQSSQTKISLFKSLFRGREDTFAQRWEKGGKAIAADFFVILLAGQEQFHLVMETLDTREATYVQFANRESCQ